MQARDGEPAILRRVEIGQVVAIADGAPALDLGVDPAQPEHEADETDGREDIEEIPEETEADERSGQEQQVGREEDGIDVVVRLAPEKAKAVTAVSSAASRYLSQAVGTRIALPATSASVASASTSTPGMTGSTGVGLASFSPEAV
jgi:hypothetical protein